MFLMKKKEETLDKWACQVPYRRVLIKKKTISFL